MGNKLITSHIVGHYPNGIVKLQLNTYHKWVNYHRYNDTEYEVSTHSDDGSDIWEEKYKVGDLNLNPNTSYLVTNAQEKDQIYFYYIPRELVSNGIVQTIYQNKTKGINNLRHNLDDYLETYYEIVVRMEAQLHAEEGIIYENYCDQGTGYLYEIAKELTDKFMEKYNGVEWDGNFLDEMDDFWQKHL